MSSVNSPGVKIKEVASIPASVPQVPTAVPVFLGYTELDPADPVRITSMPEYIAHFGGSSTNAADVLRITLASDGQDSSAFAGPNYRTLYYAMKLYFANGGGPCYVVSLGDYVEGNIQTTTQYTTGLDKAGKLDEPTLIVMPDIPGLANWAHYGTVVQYALAQCGELKNRMVLIDAMNSTNLVSDPLNIRTRIGSEYLDYGVAYYPYIVTSIPLEDRNISIANTGDGTAFGGGTLESIKNSTTPSIQQAYALYSTRIAKAIRNSEVKMTVTAAVAGQYCRVDSEQGVWKAPANVSLNGVVEPTLFLSDDDQAAMNQHDSGKSINVIRQFAGRGNLIWGARTLAGNDPEWKYIPVRRLFITVETSLKRATEFVVFEPNTASTWTRVKAMAENYLTDLWRQGALAGATPEQAFHVSVGLGETMTSQDVLEGKLIVEIGMAAVRPAEFITLRFSHKIQEA